MILKLNRSGKPAVLDSGENDFMHNKFFVIDNSTVITGSFNPTKQADMANDASILVVHSPEVAKLFAQEPFRLWDD